VTITATQLKQQTYLLDTVIKEDIQVTKRDRPFVVIVDAHRYEELLKNQKEKSSDTKTLLAEFKRLSKNVSTVDTNIDILKIEDEINNDIF
jgi:PHD/YefM family antitoxin component YafN of YafNO toxin-antitoxin module